MYRTVRTCVRPPWEEIYENDAERKQGFTEAIATYHEMVTAYNNFGYDLIEVPKVSVKERAQFIVSKMSDCFSIA